MWTSNTMDAGSAIMVSVMGIAVVFLSLIALAIAIIIVSKIVNSAQKNKKVAPVAPTAPSTSAAPIASSSADDETYAVLMAAVCEEANASPDTIQIKEIKEIK
ncbi:MAG: OadG family protein [Clostridiales bacterium]|nr:OadG family protein [Clostridiales bacterium]MCI2191941.1 OadG family protein [Oscillospiraceae bacterium]MCI1962219.1 OadG family protein [Clostridiales bacterium]MCI2022661.1 OadG family protein [Clostridiales bacterium]MCI2027024.1 OadG family protein [Clostridiales bacterium]